MYKRQTLTDALSVHLLGAIREYGEMMAENLGLGRLTRRALQPFIQTLIATPLQQALNQQYRPHVMDEKQLAMAYIRGNLSLADFTTRMQLQGFIDTDIQLLLEDTFTRLPLHDIFQLNETGFLSDQDAQTYIMALGYSRADVPLLRQTALLNEVRALDNQYAKAAVTDFEHGILAQSDFETIIKGTTLPSLVQNQYIRNGENRKLVHRKSLTLAFYKSAFLDGQVTIDEVLTELQNLGYSTNDTALYEVELLSKLAEKKKAAAAKAAKAAAK